MELVKKKVSRTQKDLARVLLIVALAKQKKLNELIDQRKINNPELATTLAETEVDALLDIFKR